ncbi:SCO2521 family protein [Streptomyces sp. ADMS]|uniref:SCO2521 family protein n=1 Tax=Streptomyces sp. ADMS TaxID=3071415 RepID=UPI00296E54F9|nr:SCO2521 family protein [Streptomyces sp. ADMS]MDW4906472.1 SCO2521 family protein [Streptomyces sp. ADMS]
MLGEIRTGLFMNRTPLPAPADARLLDLVPGEWVRVHERPVRRVVSADLPYGVDRPLFTESGGRGRGIGTLPARACVVGGRVAQGSTRTVVVAGGDRRLPWAHCLARPGVIEVGGHRAPESLQSRFLAGRDDESLDPGAVSASLAGRVQRSPLPDHRAAFPARRTRLRWAAVGGEDFHGAFALADDEARRVRPGLEPTAGATPERPVALREDLAPHDWLLATVALVVDGRAPATTPPDCARRVRWSTTWSICGCRVRASPRDRSGCGSTRRNARDSPGSGTRACTARAIAWRSARWS